MGTSPIINYVECRGEELQPYVRALAQLRMRVFRDWPYLYEGTLDYEINYLQTYLRTKDSFIALAFDGDEMVGATTAILAAREEEAFQSAFRRQGLDPERVCYFGESILLTEYRGLGVGKEFMNRRLQFARSLPGIQHCGFCSVQRPKEHPLRPASYRPLDTFWMQMGFAPVPGMMTEYSWLDVGESQETNKQMQFWLKPLEVTK